MYSWRQILNWKKNLIINSFYFDSLNFKFPFMKRLLPYLFIKKINTQCILKLLTIRIKYIRQIYKSYFSIKYFYGINHVLLNHHIFFFVYIKILLKYHAWTIIPLSKMVYSQVTHKKIYFTISSNTFNEEIKTLLVQKGSILWDES